MRSNFDENASRTDIADDKIEIELASSAVDLAKVTKPPVPERLWSKHWQDCTNHWRSSEEERASSAMTSSAADTILAASLESSLPSAAIAARNAIVWSNLGPDIERPSSTSPPRDERIVAPNSCILCLVICKRWAKARSASTAPNLTRSLA